MGELFFIELGGELDESLDGVALGDSAQGTFDFLLGDLEERVATGLESLELSNDGTESLKGVFITDLTGSVGVDVVFTGFVDEILSDVQVVEFFLEVFDLSSKAFEETIEAVDFRVSNI